MFSNAGATTVLFGEFGTVLFENVASGEERRTSGWIRMPDDGPDPGAWYCATEGTSQIWSGDQYRAELPSLSRVGPCPGVPVSGSMAVCFNQHDCGDIGLFSDVPGATFDILDFGYGVQSSMTDPHAQIEFLADGGLWVLPTQEFDISAVDLQTVPLIGSFGIVPEGLPDEGALYCISDDSTLDYRADPLMGMLPVAADLQGLSRLGACPTGQPAVATLSLCVNQGE
jgi:hypothetical protein